MNYYPFHVGDYAAHTKHLTLMGDLAYRRMLDLYYLNEGPLPLDAAECARKIGMRDYIQDVSEVLSDFFLKSEDGWISKRCDEEIDAYQAKAKRAKSANLMRWEVKKSDPGLKSDLKSDKKSETYQIATKNQEPRTNNQEPVLVPTVLVDEPSSPRLPACPTKDILELFHKNLPSLPRVEVLNDTRRRAMSARWKDICSEPDIRKSSDVRSAALDFFDWYFNHVGKSHFLTGKAKGWRADFDFLLTPIKFTKVIEGHYHREVA